MKVFEAKAAAVFFLLCMVFVPFPSLSGDVQLRVTTFLFLKPVLAMQETLFDGSFTNIPFSSDTRSLNILVVFLGLIACFIAFFVKRRAKLLLYGRTIMAYYLAFILLKYGFDKIFIGQFYTPEPNILYTPFGRLSKDILYWSAMGTSPVYSIISGCIEVVAALLLLFRRTRTLGLLLSLAVLLQIIIINFSFDISVKTFSMLLFAMAFFAAWPDLKVLYRLLALQQTVTLPRKGIAVAPHFKSGIKVFIIGGMLLQVLYPHFMKEVALPLHGAYSVEQVVSYGKTLQSADFPVKRVFFHKNNYIIFQDWDDTMADYHYEAAGNNELHLSDYHGKESTISYRFEDGMLLLDFKGQDLQFVTKPLPWEDLPALQDEFHFTVDGLK